MRIWPAIDLRGGKCVRLQQGDYNRETVFGDDPVAMARHWTDLGGECLHLVDLDGAREGSSLNFDVIRAIVSASDVPCQLGGGIRDERTIRAMLDIGLDRLVIGTKALKEPDWFVSMANQFPERLVLGIDARDGMVATNGWLETSTTRATELANRYAALPLAAIVYTDIARDGMLSGPNLDAMREMKLAVAVPVVASGGVSCIDDITNLAQLGMDGCIVGRALYEGAVRLPEMIEASKVATASLSGGEQNESKN